MVFSCWAQTQWIWAWTDAVGRLWLIILQSQTPNQTLSLWRIKRRLTELSDSLWPVAADRLSTEACFVITEYTHTRYERLLSSSFNLRLNHFIFYSPSLYFCLLFYGLSVSLFHVCVYVYTKINWHRYKCFVSLVSRLLVTIAVSRLSKLALNALCQAASKQLSHRKPRLTESVF